MDSDPSANRRHVVQRGDCLASIAERYGFFDETLWDHPDNAELRAQRVHPYALQPGDTVVIPPKESGVELGASGYVHTFRRRGIPVKLRIRMTQGDEPRAGLHYIVAIEDAHVEGTTDDDGWIEQWVPARARRARLLLEVPAEELDHSSPGSQAGATPIEVLGDADQAPPTPVEQDAPELPPRDLPTIEEYELNLGFLTPHSTEDGARARLENLGLLEPQTGASGLEAAVKAFQTEQDLEPTGELDEATHAALLEIHGC